MALRRNFLTDFQRDIGARSVAGAGITPVTFASTVNADGSLSITRNGIVIWPKVFWPGGGNAGAATDANPSADHVNIYSVEGTVSTADANQFLLNLV